jgi:hypothetical protein
MYRRTLAALATTAIISGIAVSIAQLSAAPAGARNAPAIRPLPDPSAFVKKIDNPYYPLPVGRTLVYRGVRDGLTQTDVVTVTRRTKVILGITARVVSDVATHRGRLLEKTFDWFAQDDQGNVWYMGEDTKAFGPGGKVDTSGSWEAGVKGAKAGIIMEADPRIPDSYRQEYLAGQAEDTAWIVDRGGRVTVPFGTLHHILISLESTRIEPGVYDKKVYARGIGIVLERGLTTDEVARLVRVKHA